MCYNACCLMYEREWVVENILLNYIRVNVKINL